MCFCYSKIYFSFDESVYRISNRKELDVNLIYFDDAKLKQCYIRSQFMVTATAAETLDGFKEVHCDLDYVHNMIQISMDGPNVNWKMAEIANKHYKKQDPEAQSLLEMGICGLHVLDGAYKTAQSVSS